MTSKTSLSDEELGAELAPDLPADKQIELVRMIEKLGRRTDYEDLIRVARGGLSNAE